MPINATRGVQYCWDCSTSGGYGDEGDYVDVDEEVDTVHDEGDGGIQFVEERQMRWS